MKQMNAAGNTKYTTPPQRMRYFSPDMSQNFKRSPDCGEHRVANNKRENIKDTLQWSPTMRYGCCIQALKYLWTCAHEEGLTKVRVKEL